MEEEIKRKPKKKRRRASTFGRILAFLVVTVLCLAIVAAGLCAVLFRGPFPSSRKIACNSFRETSAVRWVPGLFLPEEELKSYLLESTEDLETEQVNTSLIHVRAWMKTASRSPIWSWWTSPTAPARASC